MISTAYVSLAPTGAQFVDFSDVDASLERNWICLHDAAETAPARETFQDEAAPVTDHSLRTWDEDRQSVAFVPVKRVPPAAPSHNYRLEAPSLVELLFSYFSLFGGGGHIAKAKRAVYAITLSTISRGRPAGAETRPTFRGISFCPILTPHAWAS